MTQNSSNLDTTKRERKKKHQHAFEANFNIRHMLGLNLNKQREHCSKIAKQEN